MFAVHAASLDLEPLDEACCLFSCAYQYFGFGYYCCYNQHETNAAEQWLHLRNQNIEPTIGGLLTFNKPPRITDYYNPKTPNPKLDEDAKYNDAGDVNPRPDQNSTLRIFGIAFTEVTPTVIERSRRSCENAIKSRVLVDVPPPNMEFWRRMIAKLDDANSILYRFRPLVPTLTEALFNVWLNRFPAKTVVKLRLARASLAEREFNFRDTTIEAIVKNEKSKALMLGDDIPLANARVVMNMTDRANVATGPFYWAYSQAVKLSLSFTGTYVPVMWTPGYMTEEIGRLVEIWLTVYGQDPDDPIVFFFGDQSAMDAHCNEGSAAFERQCLILSGMPKDFIRAHIMLESPHGRAQRYPGIRFSTKLKKRITGKGNTSVGNGTVNITNLVGCLGEPGPLTWAGLFNGDDHWIVSRTSYMQKAIIGFDDRMLAMGFECDHVLTPNIHETEFCQMLFYPSADGIIPAPKIGRILYRLGSSVTNQELDVFGMVTGLYDTCYHVPFIRDFLDAHRRVLGRDYTKAFIHGNLAQSRHLDSPDTWAFLYSRYGLLPVHHEQFRALLDTVIKLPSVVSWPILSELVKVDA